MGVSGTFGGHCEVLEAESGGGGKGGEHRSVYETHAGGACAIGCQGRGGRGSLSIHL